MLGLTCRGILVRKGDLVILDVDNTFIGKGDPIDIRSKVFESVFAVTDLFGVDDPIFIPYFFGDVIKERSFLKFIPEFSAKDDGESFNGDEEVFSGREPSFAIFRDTTARDDIMDMRVIGEIPSPGMKDPHHTDETAYKPGIFGEFE